MKKINHSIIALTIAAFIFLTCFYPRIFESAMHTYNVFLLGFSIVFVKPVFYIGFAYSISLLIFKNGFPHFSDRFITAFKLIGRTGTGIWFLTTALVLLASIPGYSGGIIGLLSWLLQIMARHESIYIILGICLGLSLNYDERK